jgi:RNA polymerase sigma-70 factor (ECF subfamily)
LPKSAALIWGEAQRRSIAVARRYAPTRDEAEDIAQEALLRAWRHRGALRSRDRFLPWLATIVRNEAARVAARPALERLVLESDVAMEDEAVQHAPDRADLQRALRCLRPDERLLLRLRYEDDLTQLAIAERLGMPEGTVKVRLHRARAKLHRALSDR